MTTLVERLRQIVAAEDDDYFKDETLLYYLNRSQRKVVSEMIKREKQQHFIINQDGSRQRINITGTLRALDRLRDNVTTTPDPQNFNSTQGYFVGDISFSVSLNDMLYLKYGDKTGMREIPTNQQHMIDWGIQRPTPYEGYFVVLAGGTSSAMYKCFIHEAPSKDFKLFYIKRPEDITVSSTEFEQLPEQLHNAVVYNAAVMMNVQENIKSTDSSFQELQAIYAEELNRGTY